MYRENFALITTVYNEGDNILTFLESYYNQTCYAEEFIIVDGGSTDETIDLIKEYVQKFPCLNIKLFVDAECQKKKTIAPIAKGRNVAISHTNCKFIAVTDAGCKLDRKWFEEISAPFERDDVKAVCGYYIVNAETQFEKKFAHIFQPEDDYFLPSSRSIAFQKDLWEKVGGYPEISYTAEDTLFDLNIKKIGVDFYRATSAIVYWSFARSEGELYKKLKEYGRGEGQLLIYKRKALFRFLCLLFPFLIFVRKIYSKKRISFNVIYRFYYYQTVGYLNGIYLYFIKSKRWNAHIL